MKRIHFDCNTVVDAPYFRLGETYLSISCTPSYQEKDAEITELSCMHSSDIDAYILDLFPNLKRIITRTVGTNHINVPFFESKGIKVQAVGQYGPHVIASHAWSLILLGARDLLAALDLGKRGEYEYSSLTPIDLAGRTLGVVGVGNIGKQILRIGRAFCMDLRGYDVYEDALFRDEVGLVYTTLDDLLEKVDVLVLSCNLTKENTKMIDLQRLRSMKSGAMIVNIARGELIDEEALLLEAEKFSFIGLDVIASENPEGTEKFQQYSNIHITPHIAHFADSTIRVRWEKTYELLSKN